MLRDGGYAGHDPGPRGGGTLTEENKSEAKPGSGVLDVMMTFLFRVASTQNFPRSAVIVWPQGEDFLFRI